MFRLAEDITANFGYHWHKTLKEGELNDRVYDGLEDPCAESSAGRFVNRALLDASKQGFQRIHIAVEPAGKSNPIRVSVKFEKDGALKEVFSGPVGLWSEIVGRLKVMAFSDPHAMEKVETSINLRLGKNRTERFHLALSPTTEQDGFVVIQCAGSTNDEN